MGDHSDVHQCSGSMLVRSPVLAPAFTSTAITKRRLASYGREGDAERYEEPMDDPNTTIGTHEADEHIFSYAISDELLEAAADKEKNPVATIVSVPLEMSWCC
jgi:hypothetical protein